MLLDRHCRALTIIDNTTVCLVHVLSGPCSVAVLPLLSCDAYEWAKKRFNRINYYVYTDIYQIIYHTVPYHTVRLADRTNRDRLLHESSTRECTVLSVVTYHRIQLGFTSHSGRTHFSRDIERSPVPLQFVVKSLLWKLLLSIIII